MAGNVKAASKKKKVGKVATKTSAPARLAAPLLGVRMTVGKADVAFEDCEFILDNGTNISVTNPRITHLGGTANAALITGGSFVSGDCEGMNVQLVGGSLAKYLQCDDVLVTDRQGVPFASLPAIGREAKP